MKPIQLRKNQIHVPFIDEDNNVVAEFWVDKTDKGLQKLDEALAEVNKLANQTNEENLEEMKVFMTKCVDAILGDGAFDKLYEFNPSIEIVALYFVQVALGVQEEMRKEREVAVANEYLER